MLMRGAGAVPGFAVLVVYREVTVGGMWVIAGCCWRECQDAAGAALHRGSPGTLTRVPDLQPLQLAVLVRYARGFGVRTYRAGSQQLQDDDSPQCVTNPELEPCTPRRPTPACVLDSAQAQAIPEDGHPLPFTHGRLHNRTQSLNKICATMIMPDMLHLQMQTKPLPLSSVHAGLTASQPNRPTWQKLLS